MLYAGFTGTRNGLTLTQREGLDHLLSRFDLSSFHHGGCIGADTEAHVLTVFSHIPVYLYPCNLPQFQTEFDDKEVVWRGEPKDPLERNKDIVDNTSFLIACPKSYVEEKRGSGTWATIRYAWKLRRPVYILL